MGAGNSTMSWQPEIELLSKGIELYQKCAKDANRAAPAVRATLFDVPLIEKDYLGQPQHIHTVWYHTDEKNNSGENDHENLVQTVDKPPLDLVQSKLQSNQSSYGGPLVMIHGYGSGAGIYCTTAPAITNHWNGPVFSIDLLGCGLSSRPPHNPAIGTGKDSDINKATEFFVEGLEQWRKQMQFGKMTLVAHSLGGYLSTCYCEKYPENVERLVVVGCAGVPDKPEGFEEKLQKRSYLLRSFMSLFTDGGWSPMAVCRYTPAMTLIGNYVRRRFGGGEHVPSMELKHYIYNSWTSGQVSTGGYAHNLILGQMAYAKYPLHDRFKDLKVKKIAFVYGETDWMNPEHGLAVKTKLDGNSNAPNADFYLIANAGHNCMIDNPTAFTSAIATAITSDIKTSQECQTFGRNF